jgi:hypothetical protein
MFDVAPFADDEGGKARNRSVEGLALAPEGFERYWLETQRHRLQRLLLSKVESVTRLQCKLCNRSDTVMKAT